MWVLFADGLAYLAYGTISGHFWRDLRPTGPRILLRDLGDALRFCSLIVSAITMLCNASFTLQ